MTRTDIIDTPLGRMTVADMLTAWRIELPANATVTHVKFMCCLVYVQYEIPCTQEIAQEQTLDSTE